MYENSKILISGLLIISTLKFHYNNYNENKSKGGCSKQ